VEASRVKIFCLYAKEDSELFGKLNSQLMAYLRHQPIKVEFCHNVDISPGKDRRSEISLHLNSAHIILLPISPNFMNLDDYDLVVTRAMERHLQENVRVIPVILRPVHWKNAPFSKLQVLPKNKKPVMNWSKLDNALYDVTKGIDEVINPFCDQPSEEPVPAISELTITDLVNTTNALSQYTVMWNPGEYTSSQTLVHHLGPISSVTLSSDATVLISDSWDKELLYWNVYMPTAQKVTAQKVRTLTQLSRPIYAVSFNNDETFVATGGDDGIVRVWNPYTGSELGTLAGHTGPVSCVAFSPDGKILVSASDDHTIKIWNPYTGSELRTLVGHTGPVSCVTFSPDGKILVSGSYDKTLKVWDSSREYLFTTLTDNDTDIIRCVAFHLSPVRSPRASQKDNYWDVKLVSGDQHGNIRIYSTSTRDIEALKQSIDKVEKLLPAEWHMEQKLWQPGPVYSMASHRSSGALISGAHDGIIRVWDPSIKKVLETFEEHKKAVTCVAVSMDGNIIISSSLDNTVHVRRTRNASHTLPAPNSYPSTEVCPICQKKVNLAHCAKISTLTLKAQKKVPISGWLTTPHLWLVRTYAKPDDFTVAGDIRILCPNCNYVFPPHKISEVEKKDSFLRKNSAKAAFYFSIILISIILVIWLLVRLSNVPAKNDTGPIPNYTYPVYTTPIITTPIK
jgi:WD40 repeat protein